MLCLTRGCMAIVLVIIPAVPLLGVQNGKGEQYAFLVGCSQYSQSEFRKLPYTGNDVEQFRKALLQTGFDKDHIVVLHDDCKETRYRPLKTHIVKELALWLDGVRAEDTLVVALSGHGVQFKGDPASYFVPVDGNLTDKSTLIPLSGQDGLYARLKACKAKKKLLIVNACRNDPTLEPSFASKKFELVDEDRNDEVPDGIAAIYSCKAGQKSYYDPERKLAVFFDHVIRAWKGEYTKGEQVTLEAFFQQVTVKTKVDASKTYGEGQVPVVLREYKGEWVITKAGVGLLLEEVAELTRLISVSDVKGWEKWLETTAAKRLTAWREAAANGAVEAMWLLGNCLECGKGATTDYAEAVKWYRMAAEQGYAQGQNQLAWMYVNGLGVTKDYAEAVKWYRKAAEQGYAGGQNQMGFVYENGRGVAKDEAEAVKWYRKAAEQGDALGQYNLGCMYENGLGVTKNLNAAIYWYRLARDGGSQLAVQALQSLGQ
jgi:hypothetical protein